MRLVLPLVSILFAAYAQADCSKDRAHALKVHLGDAEGLLTTLRDQNKNFFREKDKYVKMIQSLSSSDPTKVVGEMDVTANELVSFAMVPVKKSIETIRMGVQQGLQSGDPKSMMNDIARSMDPGIKRIAEFKASSADGKDSIVEKAKKEYIFKTAFDRFYGEVQQMMQVTRQEVETKCLSSGVSFEVQIQGGKYKFKNCVKTSVIDMDAEKWGGKVPTDGCRHIVTCNEVKGPEDQAVGTSTHNWVVDCKKRADKCEEIAACAAQAQGSNGRVRSAAPGGGSAR